MITLIWSHHAVEVKGHAMGLDHEAGPKASGYYTWEFQGLAEPTISLLHSFLPRHDFKMTFETNVMKLSL